MALAAAFAYEAAWVAHLRMHPADRSAAAIALEVLLPLAAGVVAWVAATRSGRRGLGMRTARLALLAAGMPLAFAAVTELGWPADPHDGAFWQQAVGCMISGALFVAGPLVIAGLTFRGAFASASVWRAAALGVGCGALATATLGVVCPLATAGHLVVGHGAALVLAGVAGALLGRRIVLA